MNTFPPFQTYGAILTEILTLDQRGWTIQQADDQEIAEIGFIAHKPERNVERFRKLIWYPFGRTLVPQRQVADSAEEFFELFEEHLPHRLYKCDNTDLDLMGFVCYCQQKNRKALVFQADLDVARDLGDLFFLARDEAENENVRLLLCDA